MNKFMVYDEMEIAFSSFLSKTEHAGRNLMGPACLIIIILIREISTQMRWRLEE